MLLQGRLNELMSQLRMQNQSGAARLEAGYQMDPNVQLELQQVLFLLIRSINLFVL